MDFNDLTQKFTSKVKKLSKDTAEEVQKLNKIRQLNGKANDAKKQIENIYSEIGKKFYEMNRDDAPEGFEELIQTINEKKAEIEQLREQVREVKGIVVCPNCSTEVSGDERFCPNCGGRMPEVIEPADEEDEASVVADVAEEAAEAAADTVEDVKEAAADAAEDAKEAAADAAEGLKERAEDAAENLKEAASGLAGEAKEVASDIAEGAKEVAGKAFEELKETVEDVKEDVERKF